MIETSHVDWDRSAGKFARLDSKRVGDNLETANTVLRNLIEARAKLETVADDLLSDQQLRICEMFDKQILQVRFWINSLM